MREVLKISAGDSVAVALTALNAGAVLEVEGVQVTLATDVPAGHKFALKEIKAGEWRINVSDYKKGAPRIRLPFGGL